VWLNYPESSHLRSGSPRSTTAIGLGRKSPATSSSSPCLKRRRIPRVRITGRPPAAQPSAVAGPFLVSWTSMSTIRLALSAAESIYRRCVPDSEGLPGPDDRPPFGSNAARCTTWRVVGPPRATGLLSWSAGNLGREYSQVPGFSSSAPVERAPGATGSATCEHEPGDRSAVSTAWPCRPWPPVLRGASGRPDCGSCCLRIALRASPA